MRKILLASAVALSLGGCVTDNANPGTIGSSIGTIGGILINQYAPELVSAVGSGCSFIITAADFTGLTGNYPSVSEAARAICAAVTARRSSARAGQELTVTVRGVRVRGRFG